MGPRPTSIGGGYQLNLTGGEHISRLVETAGRKQSLLLAHATWVC